MTYRHVCCGWFLGFRVERGEGVGMGFELEVGGGGSFLILSFCHPFSMIKSIDRPLLWSIKRSTSRTELLAGTGVLSMAIIASPTANIEPGAFEAGLFGAMDKITTWSDSLTRRMPRF